jgi:Kelch motif
MQRLRITTIFLVALAALLAPTAATSTRSGTGSWHRLPAAPVSFTQDQAAVWTGRQMIVFGRAQPNPPWSRDVAATYNPVTHTWRKLTPFRGDKGNYEGRYQALWSGRKMLLFGPFDFQAFNPLTNRWQRLPRSLPAEFSLGLAVWTGREAIAWGGGCCADASSAGWAYNPATGRTRKLARSPLAPSNGPMGAWTGSRLIVLITGMSPEGKPYRASFSRAATYDPATNTWRSIAPVPAPHQAATVIWDGHELLVVGAGKAARSAFAYDPATNRWRTLAQLPSPRFVGIGVWTGSQALLIGGRSGKASKSLHGALAYDPTTNRWTRLPAMPFGVDRFNAVAVWTGRQLVVTSRAGSAAFTPTR